MLENLGIGYAFSWISDRISLGSFFSESHLDVPGDDLDDAPASGREPVHRRHGHRPKMDNYEHDDQHFPGLVNISGTYCFMNSVLQAFSSLRYLQPHLDAVHDKAEVWDVPTPITDTLRETLTILNTSKSKHTCIRPTAMIDTLSAPLPDGTRTLLFSSREHQDAQELFQLLSSQIKSEATAVERETTKELGLSTALYEEDVRPGGSNEIAKGVFDGLTANRRSCVDCGYTEAVMHFAFDTLQLSLPFTHKIELEECLRDFTHIEPLTDCICRKCSLRTTQARLAAEAMRLSASSGPDEEVSTSRKKRLKEVKKLENKVKTALEEGRIEEDIKGLKLEKVYSKMSTKQAMIARTPPILVLHLNRSSYYGRATKNPCNVIYPEVLDMTPFSTSGSLSTSPSAPISSPAPAAILSQLASASTRQSAPSERILYLLSAVVVHYGGHGFGHYIAYRRRPTPSSSSSSKPKLVQPPTLADISRRHTGRGWLRISDDDVQECGIENALSETSGVFMLFYERIASDNVPAESTPKLTEKDNTLSATTPNGNVGHSQPASSAPNGHPVVDKANEPNHSPRLPLISRKSAPRIVRSVSAGLVPRASSAGLTTAPPGLSSPPSIPPTLPEEDTSNAIEPELPTLDTVLSPPTPDPHPASDSETNPPPISSVPLASSPSTTRSSPRKRKKKNH